MAARGLLSEFWERGKALAQFACVVHLFHEHVLEITMVRSRHEANGGGVCSADRRGCGMKKCMGPSMVPTLNPEGDVVLLDRLFSKFQGIRKGDVVVATSMQNPKQTVCKRVAALAGEKAPCGTLVPKGHVWLLGDNRLNSTDSRQYGPVPMAMVKGRVFLRVWPPWCAGTIK